MPFRGPRGSSPGRPGSGAGLRVSGFPRRQARRFLPDPVRAAWANRRNRHVAQTTGRAERNRTRREGAGGTMNSVAVADACHRFFSRTARPCQRESKGVDGRCDMGACGYGYGWPVTENGGIAPLAARRLRCSRLWKSRPAAGFPQPAPHDGCAKGRAARMPVPGRHRSAHRSDSPPGCLCRPESRMPQRRQTGAALGDSPLSGTRRRVRPCGKAPRREGSRPRRSVSTSANGSARGEETGARPRLPG